MRFWSGLRLLEGDGGGFAHRQASIFDKVLQVQLLEFSNFSG
jgi:hypothetical protein